MDSTSKLETVLNELKNKESNFYFFTLDTKGNPTAGVANIYEHVKVLTELGYKAHILHEKNDYKLRVNEEGMGIADWLGEEYAELSHVSIEGQELQVKPSDFMFIPEIFASVMEQVKNMSCKKIVFAQSPEYMFEVLPIGRRWTIDYGFNDVITTSDRVAEHIKNHFPDVNAHVIPVSIPEYFKPSDKPKKPIVTLVARNQSDVIKITKSFYLQYPLYKWVTFKELRGLPRKQFAQELSESFLSVWVDDLSGFGTFPIEAMECNTPVIGKMPNILPEWMETKDEDGNPILRDNGIWTNTTQNIPELIGRYLKLYLEDSEPTEILENMEKTRGTYTSDVQRDKIEVVYGNLMRNRMSEIEALMEKTNQLQETKTETNEQ
jgi:hypothetical protein